ncbi:MAG TPA: YbhB/YbcL family Raf kinase inhibitor-like protein [Gammaproteobacteria bacterium]|nr:YbhB/YbcL family Raf kinase inhibitor-like protein [Gammaproteobacteria bacterium]
MKVELAAVASSCAAAMLLLTAGAALAAGGFRLTSPAFSAGGTIPVRYTCDGRGSSPPLAWQGVPGGTRSLALIVDDPDAPRGTFVHWVLYNLPVSTTHLGAGVDPKSGMPRFGVNSRGDAAYTGMCPPSGAHHYHFKLYALDTRLPAQGHMTKAELLQAMQGHELGMAELVGVYRRHKNSS